MHLLNPKLAWPHFPPGTPFARGIRPGEGHRLAFHSPTCWKPPFSNIGAHHVLPSKTLDGKKEGSLRQGSAEPSTRGRPRRSAHSTYATTTEDQVEEEPAVENQPPTSKEQQVPSPTPKQELQQLQAQLQSMQQERDRVAVAFTTNQASAQAVEIRQ